MLPPIPYKQGWSKKRDVDNDPSLVATPTKSWKLTEMTDEWVLFSHALLFVCGNLTTDPLLDAEQTLGRDLGIVVMESDAPVFHCPDADWSRLIFAAPKEEWETVKETLASIGGYRQSDQFFWRTLLQHIRIVDRVALASMSVVDTLPTVPFWSFGVDSNIATFALGAVKRRNAKVPDPTLEGVWLAARFPPSDETIRLGKAIAAGHANPFRTIDPLYNPEMKTSFE